MSEGYDEWASAVRTWWVPTVSLMLLGALTAVVWVQVPASGYALLDVLLPAAFVGLAVWEARRFARAGPDEAATATVARWFTGGLVVMACLGLWPPLLRAVGQPAVPVGVRLLTEIIAGGLFGLLVGVHSVRARRSAEDAATARVERRFLERQRETSDLLNRTLRHQLLNGLTVVRGRAELLADGRSDGEVAQAVVDRADEMAATVETIGILTETLADGVDPEPVALRPLVEERVAAARADHPAAEFTVDCEGAPTVRADDLLGRALDNVLTNAVVHNDTERPTVAVRVTVDGDRGVVTVADDGPGIPDPARDRVFEPNERGLGSEGNGLGLFVTATAVRNYGGEVRLGDADLGGAAVTLAVPLATSDLADFGAEERGEWTAARSASVLGLFR